MRASARAGPLCLCPAETGQQQLRASPAFTQARLPPAPAPRKRSRNSSARGREQRKRVPASPPLLRQSSLARSRLSSLGGAGGRGRCGTLESQAGPRYRRHPAQKRRRNRPAEQREAAWLGPRTAARAERHEKRTAGGARRNLPSAPPSLRFRRSLASSARADATAAPRAYLWESCASRGLNWGVGPQRWFSVRMGGGGMGGGRFRGIGARLFL